MKEWQQQILEREGFNKRDMEKQELLDYIQNRLSGIGQCDWYTAEDFVKEMTDLVFKNREI